MFLLDTDHFVIIKRCVPISWCLQNVALDTEANQRVQTDPNLNADVAIMVLSR